MRHVIAVLFVACVGLPERWPSGPTSVRSRADVALRAEVPREQPTLQFPGVQGHLRTHVRPMQLAQLQIQTPQAWPTCHCQASWLPEAGCPRRILTTASTANA
jgi:hypothetical protein